MIDRMTTTSRSVFADRGVEWINRIADGSGSVGWGEFPNGERGELDGFVRRRSFGNGEADFTREWWSGFRADGDSAFRFRGDGQQIIRRLPLFQFIRRRLLPRHHRNSLRLVGHFLKR